VFKEIDADQEAAILAASSKRKKGGPDYTIRTNTHWFTLPQNLSHSCTVPLHGENIPETDKSGNPYDTKRSRITVEIEEYHVCRWCFMGSLDLMSREQNLKPLEEAA
jgi:hypothetical protein